MLIPIIRKELFDQLLSLRFAVACVVCLIVLPSSLVVRFREYKESASAYRINLSAHRSEVLSLVKPWDLWKGVNVDRPLNLLKIFVQGVCPEYTESVRVISRANLRFQPSYTKNPIVPLFPVVDFSFFVGTIMSLIALTFSYDAISGERERGTLRLVMSYSVPRDLVLFGKWIGGYLALIVPFLIVFLVGLMIIHLSPDVGMGTRDVLALVILVFLALLYLAAVYSLGLFISARTRLMATSIIVLLLVWVVMTLVIPSTAPYIVHQFLLTPSREAVDREIEELLREGWREGRSVETEIQKIKENYTNALNAETRWARCISRLSPFASFTFSVLNISGTGMEAEDRFLETLKKHGQMWYEYTRRKCEALDRYVREHHGTITDADIARFKLDPSDYPKFGGLVEISLKDRLGQALLDVLLLGIWNIVLFAGAYISFLRYNVC